MTDLVSRARTTPGPAAQGGASATAPKVLFIACSSFSGSTLLSFLLNTHSRIFTVGHTGGWRYSEDEDFRCSCGEPLETCPLFRHVAAAFRDSGLAFAFNDFGTHFRVTGNERLNRWLTGPPPVLRYTMVEHLRDAVVRLNPQWAAALSRQGLANRTFIEAALAYSGAQVYVDNTHSPYRLRLLARTSGLDIAVVYLHRDVRGVVNSFMKNHGWELDFAIQTWLREQSNILRIVSEFDRILTVRYDDLCEDTDACLAEIHRFVDLDPQRFEGSFTVGEHHILGNAMRLRESTVHKDVRWRETLSPEQIERIEAAARAFASRHRDDPLTAIMATYLPGL